MAYQLRTTIKLSVAAKECIDSNTRNFCNTDYHNNIAAMLDISQIRRKYYEGYCRRWEELNA